VQPVGLTADINPKPATISASNQTKAFGSVLTLGPGQKEFTVNGLVAGEAIDTVTLVASGGTQSQDPVGLYTLTASDPVGGAFNRFRSGNYNFTYLGGYLIVVDPAAPLSYSDWATQNALSGTNALADADPDNDKLPNLLEYYMNLDPNSAGGSFGYGVSVDNGNSISLTYRRAKYIQGVSATIQTSTDLSGNNWANAVAQERVVDRLFYDEVTATVVVPQGGTKMFMRLGVSQP